MVVSTSIDANPAIPTPAAALGYNTETFGSGLTLGQNWFPMAFSGNNPALSGATQNSDGSVAISGAGGDNSYNAQISTATPGSTPSNWIGEAFRGRGLFSGYSLLHGYTFHVRGLAIILGQRRRRYGRHRRCPRHRQYRSGRHGV